MENERNNVNREYKDRLFKRIFREKEDLLQLYNAVNGTNYNNPEDIEVNTLEDTVYMRMKNDVSFLMQSVLNLYEHQSTFSPNLPLRGIFYFADLYRKMMTEAGKDLYGSRRVMLPFPQYIIFYNGTQEEPERQILHLCDSFPKEIMEVFGEDAAALNCHAVVLNINYGHNRKIMKKCRKLEEYSIFIDRIREKLNEKMPLREAIDHAVDACIKDGILEKILRENREEVCSMLLTEYDERAHIENEKRISEEEGIEKGEDLMAALITCLKRDGRMDDLDLISDKEARQQLYKEYHLKD